MATLAEKKDKQYKRAEFEQYAREHWGCSDQHFFRSPFSKSLYRLTSMQDRWIGWQAAIESVNKT
jgi:hypothetical protein